MLYSIFSLVIYFIYSISSMYVPIPISQFPPPPSFPLVSAHLFSRSVSLQDCSLLTGPRAGPRPLPPWVTELSHWGLRLTALCVSLGYLLCWQRIMAVTFLEKNAEFFWPAGSGSCSQARPPWLQKREGDILCFRHHPQTLELQMTSLSIHQLRIHTQHSPAQSLTSFKG